jgi:aspartyl-tRNA(Asn)/glutamyl-tRNA(Gln) amidotransferase subunit B
MAVEARTRYETVIGIEVHAQLRTESKMFCSCPTSPPPDGTDEPNSRVCPICLGMPGTLPVINRRAVELVMLTGLALNCNVETDAVRFERKNYFYPDLPKGYQISQYALPLTSNGRLVVPVPAEGTEVTIGITRAHLEEDTARMQHAGRGYSVVDFNRAGVPLMEIVTEPDLRSPAQARAYGETLRELLRAIGASNADMEAGSMRIEGNISLRPVGATRFGTKVEVKNLNSFRSLERALAYEAERHAAALERGEPLVQETRGWDEEAGRTIVQRSKEEANDYRYFPEPDLPPLVVDRAWLDELGGRLPELPAARRTRYRDELGLPASDAGVIVSDPAASELLEGVLAADAGLPPRKVANWVTGEFLRLAKERPEVRVEPGQLAELVRRVEAGDLSGTNAKQVFAEHVETGQPVSDIVGQKGLARISDSAALGAAVDEVLAANPDAVADVRAGKGQAIGFLVGQVMKATRGRANPGLVNELLRKQLDA